MARVAKADKQLFEDFSGVRFVFANGAEMVAKLADFSDEIKTRLAVHGLSQKLGDSYASAEDVKQAYDWAKETLSTLLEGKWSTRTAGNSGPKTTLLARAIARVSKQPLDSIIEKLATLDEDTVKALRANDDIKLAISEIKVEDLRNKKATSDDEEEDKVDVGALFAG